QARGGEVGFVGRSGSGGGPRGGRSGCGRRGRGGRAADRVRRVPVGGRGQEDPGDQGRARADRTWPEGSQGPGRRRTQACEGEDCEGRGGGHEEEARGGGRYGGSEVEPPLWRRKTDRGREAKPPPHSSVAQKESRPDAPVTIPPA